MKMNKELQQIIVNHVMGFDVPEEKYIALEKIGLTKQRKVWCLTEKGYQLWEEIQKSVSFRKI